MNQIFGFFILLMAMSDACFSQTHSKVYSDTQEGYLKQSRDQKIGGFVLLGLGAGSIAVVSLGNQSFSTTGTVAVLGGVAILGSVPLFLASGRNKRKARAMQKASKAMAIGQEYINYRLNQPICEEGLLSGTQVLQQQPSD